jgi:hypothetical protein
MKKSYHTDFEQSNLLNFVIRTMLKTYHKQSYQEVLEKNNF